MKLLIVYNTCGISGRDNTQFYIDAIKTIQSQTFKHYKLAISACLNPKEQIDRVIKESNPDFVNRIEEILPVNITFNSTVKEAVKQYGEFDGYLYLDSGIKFTNIYQLEQLVRLFETKKFSMVSAQVNNDFGWCWFGYPNDSYKPTLPYHLIVPVGRACNLHCQIFSNDILKEYGNIIPDIFKSYCTESVLSFLNAAIKKQWVISCEVMVHHEFSIPIGQPDNGDGMDGHSSGFRAPGGTWDDVYPPYTMKEIISLEEGTSTGFGYEELHHIKDHNRSCFDENEYCINDKLKEFLKKYLYRQDFDYDKINKETVCYH